MKCPECGKNHRALPGDCIAIANIKCVRSCPASNIGSEIHRQMHYDGCSRIAMKNYLEQKRWR